MTGVHETTIPSPHNTLLLVQCRTIWISSNFCLFISMIFGILSPYCLRSQLLFLFDEKITTHLTPMSITTETIVSTTLFYFFIKFGIEAENILFDLDLETCHERRRFSYTIPSTLIYFLLSFVSNIVCCLLSSR